MFETVADISFIAGNRRYYSGDSCIDVSDFISWANEFEEINQFTDWYDQDYMIEIELFANKKINEARLNNKLN